MKKLWLGIGITAVIIIALFCLYFLTSSYEIQAGSAVPMNGILFILSEENERIPYYVTHSIICQNKTEIFDKPNIKQEYRNRTYEICDFSGKLDKVLTEDEVKKITRLNKIIPRLTEKIITKEEAMEAARSRINFYKDAHKSQNFSFSECIAECEERNKMAYECEPKEGKLCPYPIENCTKNCNSGYEDKKKEFIYWNQTFYIGLPILNFYGTKISTHLNAVGYTVPVYNKTKDLIYLYNIDASNGDWVTGREIHHSETKYDNFKELQISSAKDTLQDYLKSNQIKGTISDCYFVMYPRKNLEFDILLET